MADQVIVLWRWEFYLSILVILIISRIVKWWTNPLRKIPGPRGYPIFGNTFDYSIHADFHEVLLERTKKYGQICKDYTIFAGTNVYVNGPEYAKQVLVTNSSNFNRSKNLIKQLPALGTGLLTTNGSKHALMRKHLNPSFTLGNVKQFVPIFNSKASQLVQYFTDKISEHGGKSIEMQMMEKFTDLTLDVIGLCAFSYSFDCVLGGETKESCASNTILTANFNVVRRSFETMIPLLKFIPSKEREELKIAEDTFYGLIKKVIAKRKEELLTSPEETMQKGDLLQKLISMYEAAGLSISNKDLFHQIFTFMLAGHETTSLSMTWFIFLIAKYNEFQPRLRKEIKDVLNGRKEVTFDDLDKLKFLDDCLKETMRVHPVGLAVSRSTVKEEKIGPYTIPPETNILVSIGSLLRDPKLWKNPDEFNPDRFQSEDEHDPLFPYYYLPFSRGPRMCIGYRFAQMEMKVVLANLLNNFSFKLAKSQPSNIKGKNVLTYRPNPAPIIEITMRTTTVEE